MNLARTDPPFRQYSNVEVKSARRGEGQPIVNQIMKKLLGFPRIFEMELMQPHELGKFPNIYSANMSAASLLVRT